MFEGDAYDVRLDDVERAAGLLHLTPYDLLHLLLCRSEDCEGIHSDGRA